MTAANNEIPVPSDKKNGAKPGVALRLSDYSPETQKAIASIMYTGPGKEIFAHLITLVLRVYPTTTSAAIRILKKEGLIEPGPRRTEGTNYVLTAQGEREAGEIVAAARRLNLELK